ncbi:MAG: LysM peptidoglycan-binding domain-containing protein [Peptococcaceae bacterium]|jgi:LysM repeat protein|nr:LysM peptidoglycan-binding domain-containing protein [Peptococcaceae bacterium]
MSTCPRGTIRYTVKAGDTFYALAQRFNTTITAISSVNPGVNPNNLRVGQRICIPVRRTVTPCPPSSRYVIQPGDTFSKISQRYGIPLRLLLSLNRGVDPNNLQIGQIICVPRRRRRSR